VPRRAPEGDRREHFAKREKLHSSAQVFFLPFDLRSVNSGRREKRREGEEEGRSQSTAANNPAAKSTAVNNQLQP
jgi:hypothetical protein